MLFGGIYFKIQRYRGKGDLQILCSIKQIQKEKNTCWKKLVLMYHRLLLSWHHANRQAWEIQPSSGHLHDTNHTVYTLLVLIWVCLNLELISCDQEPCQNGGVCSEKSGRFNCTCPKGYSGLICQNGKVPKPAEIPFKFLAILQIGENLENWCLY